MFEITSYGGASLIKFGIRREEVRKLMSEYEPKVSWETFYSEPTIDRYDKAGVNVHYDIADKVIALVFYEPAQVVF